MIKVVALVSLAAAIVTGRIVYSSRMEARSAEQWESSGDVAGAIRHWSRAVKLYLPVDPAPRRALERLASIAESAAVAGDVSTEISAWREIRAAILATRWLITPHPDLLARANGRIADLMSAAESPSGTEANAAARRWHSDRLARTEEPHRAWSLIALIGFALWIASAVRLFLDGVTADGRLRDRKVVRWASGTALGLLLFLVGLAIA